MRPIVEIPDGIELVLASGSSRRRELLAQLGFEFEVRPADIDETPRRGETPIDYVRRLSFEKAATVAGPDEVVIAADTTIDVDGTIFEKPLDDDDARRMLRALSGRTHQCHTGVTVIEVGCGSELAESIVVTTTVTFAGLDDDTIDWYVASGESNGKAGAYAIQGAASAFVIKLDGSITNVIGLPVTETLAMLGGALG